MTLKDDSNDPWHRLCECVLKLAIDCSETLLIVSFKAFLVKYIRVNAKLVCASFTYAAGPQKPPLIVVLYVKTLIDRK
jgi:hypothetical protein